VESGVSLSGARVEAAHDGGHARAVKSGHACTEHQESLRST
jgi:hypothetical protein